MRAPLSEWPQALLRRWLLSAAAGVGFLLAGLTAFFALHDHILLIISALLALFTTVRCIIFYHAIAGGGYETVEGVCVGIRRTPLRQLQTIRLMTMDGVEQTLSLDKRTHLRIGNRYRVYFRHAQTQGGAIFPQGLQAQDQLMGFEDLGEFHAEQE